MKVWVCYQLDIEAETEETAAEIAFAMLMHDADMIDEALEIVIVTNDPAE